jgi:thiol-disulfide isomerase/thioredoxin
MRKLLGFLLMASAVQAEIVTDVRTAMATGDFGLASKLVADYHASHGATPEVILADSWIGRGLLDSGNLSEADKHAAEARTWALALLPHRKLDAEPALPEALGAAIEVHARVLEKNGDRSQAVAFLRAESARWRDTSIRARIQKNLNLLTLEGKIAPPLDVSSWTGDVKPRPLSAMRGHPVLLFFWAHWCADCKAEAGVIQDLLARYGASGLKVVGPTMHYGFVGGGEEAPRDKETAWIEETRKKYYAKIGIMPVPLSGVTMRLYGVSTTPTLVLVDGHGIVRLYHPGLMSLQELAPIVKKRIAG